MKPFDGACLGLLVLCVMPHASHTGCTLAGIVARCQRLSLEEHLRYSELPLWHWSLTMLAAVVDVSFLMIGYLL